MAKIPGYLQTARVSDTARVSAGRRSRLGGEHACGRGGASEAVQHVHGKSRLQAGAVNRQRSQRRRRQWQG